MASYPIRVLLVEDSPVAIHILKRILASSPDIEVVGVAHNGIEALELIPRVQPSVICTDLHMPKMSGMELIRRIMVEYPRPILVISASVQEEDTQNVFQLLQAGALDIFPKPRTGLPSEYEQAKTELINRIKVLSGVSVFTQRFRQATPVTPAIAPKSPPAPSRSAAKPAASLSVASPYSTAAANPRLDIRSPRIVAIGSSTGGPQALHTIFKQLPAHFPLPILCVQHISEGFLQGLVDWLGLETSLRIKIAQAGEVPQPGVVYFPPERRHMQVDSQGRISFSNSPPVAGHCPSVTVLFQAVAAYYRQSAIGILLTGMGRDGAEGLLDIANAGGITIAQNEQSCIVFGMPREAIALGAVQHVLGLDDIVPTLMQKIDFAR
ncbi:MAG TPA: chemotaxis-specific protein-glutamate methyltransferase CheB [Allocoleopsis sp.]